MARRGARSIELPARPAVAGEAGQPSGPAPVWERDEWQRDDRQRDGRARAPRSRSAAPEAGERKRTAALGPGVAQEIARHVKGRGAAAIERRLAEAAGAFERDRISEAVRLLVPLALDHPGVAPIRELTGLALYRAGRWAEAARHLEASRSLTASVDQLPVLADCYRALKRYRLVDQMWEELRAASPPVEILAEGRIVAAGSLADRGRMPEAIALLERVSRTSRRGRGGPPLWDVRTWYALGDLCERVGDSPRARELFSRVVAAEPDMADAAERLATLS